MPWPNYPIVESPRWHLDCQVLTKPADTEKRSAFNLIVRLAWQNWKLRLANLHVFHCHIPFDSVHTALLISAHLMRRGIAICCSSLTFVSLTPNRLSCHEMSRGALPVHTSASDFQPTRAVSVRVRSWGRDVAGARRRPDGCGFCLLPPRRDSETGTSLNPVSGRRGYSFHTPTLLYLSTPSPCSCSAETSSWWFGGTVCPDWMCRGGGALVVVLSSDN